MGPLTLDQRDLSLAAATQRIAQARCQLESSCAATDDDHTMAPGRTITIKAQPAIYTTQGQGYFAHGVDLATKVGCSGIA